METLVDTFAFIKSQTTVISLYVNEIKSTLSAVQDKINEMEENFEKQEEKFEKLEDKFEKLEERVEQKFTDLQEQNSAIMNGLTDQGAALETQTAAIEEHTTQTASMSEDVSRTLTATLTLKSRQQTILSEVRLISLYKPTGQTSTWAGPGHESELVSDGLYTFSERDWASMATYSHTGTNSSDNKIWLELGGWFKIHKVKVCAINLRSVQSIFAVCNQSFAVCNQSFAVCNQSFAVCNQSFAVCNQSLRSVQSIFTQCAINLIAVCNQSFRSVQSIFSQCAINLFAVCNQSFRTVQSIFRSVQSIFSQCAINLSQCAINLLACVSQCAINLLACVLITVCLLSVNRITVLRLPYSPAIQGLYTLWNFL